MSSKYEKPWSYYLRIFHPPTTCMKKLSWPSYVLATYNHSLTAISEPADCLETLYYSQKTMPLYRIVASTIGYIKKHAWYFTSKTVLNHLRSCSLSSMSLLLTTTILQKSTRIRTAVV